MRFDLSEPFDTRQARAQLEHLIKKGAKVEITEKRKQRTYSQNAYLHLILTSWGRHIGLDLDEMKQMVKMHLMPSMFRYTRKGITLYKSTADLNTKQMTIMIDKIRLTALEKTGFDIPAPNEEEHVRSMANEAERYG